MTAQIFKFPTPQDREGRQPGARRSPLRSTAAPECRRLVSSVAMDWAWTRPVRGPRQHVLLALAKKVKPKSEVATPSMPELVEMTGLSESTVRAHVQALAKDGIIQVKISNGGRHKRSEYTLTGCLTPREIRGSKDIETPQEITPCEPETPQLPVENPPTAGPVVLRTSGGTRGERDGDAVAPPPPLTDDDFASHDGGMFKAPVTEASEKRNRNKIAGAITARYQAVVPLSNRPAVHGVVEKALRSNYSGEQVMAALLRIADDNRAVTTDTVRIEIEGFGKPRTNGHRRNGTDFDALQAQFSGGGAA